ncbi:NAD(P)/FAD-dependent oxidoreductase [Candidatus Parcubacteria bacterium]|nr:NAD(P)/FAD-dependent oxidoreductase [Candidatus Parcubacteria bacterium]
MKQYNLAVFGTGGAGYRAAMACKLAGWSVAVVNDGLFGGTCAVRGCVPKKVLSGTAEIADVNRRLGELGIVKRQAEFSWQDLIKHKRSYTDPVSPRTKKGLVDAGIDVYEGSPKFVGDMEIEVKNHKLKAEKVYIAVGSKPAKLPIEGFEYLATSDDFLEMDNLPPSIIFVGGGYISFELAHIAARFGAKVTILHKDERPLPMFDKDIIDALLEASKEAGIKVNLNSETKKIEKNGKKFKVTTASGKTIEADSVVHGAGRPPAIDEMNLEAANIDYDLRRGVLVNEYLRSTSNPNVYAGGDAAATGPPLSPVASRHGVIIAENLLGGKVKQPSYHSTSSVIFTTPPVGKVGYLEQEAKDKGIDFEATLSDISGWFDSSRLNLKHAKSKVLVERKTGKIIGAHLIGNHADDLTNLFSIAIENGLTAKQLKKPILAFPTSSDDMSSMF